MSLHYPQESFGCARTRLFLPNPREPTICDFSTRARDKRGLAEQISNLLDSGVLPADGDHGLLELLPDPGHGEEVRRPHLAQRVDQAPLEGVLVREVDGKSPSMNLFNKLFKIVGTAQPVH